MIEMAAGINHHLRWHRACRDRIRVLIYKRALAVVGNRSGNKEQEEYSGSKVETQRHVHVPAAAP